MVELVLRVRCVHGRMACADMVCAHGAGEHPQDIEARASCWCPGGRETVLDPERVAWDYGDTFIDFHTMAPIEQWRRIFDALTKGDSDE